MATIADIAVAALQSDQARLRVVSENLANTQTPGYRSAVASPSLAPRFDTLLESPYDSVAQLTQQGLRSDRPGSLQQTNRQLDLAIEGRGYFQLLDNGQVVYSRRGDFHIDQQGVLRGEHDLPVVGRAGEIRLPDANVVVRPDGKIEKDGIAIDQIAIAQFDANTRFAYAGDGLFVTDEAPLATPVDESHVRQGFVEAANVRPMTEITQMMEITRRFGASAQALKAYDQMLESALTGLGSN